jgi:hypothetical protein
VAFSPRITWLEGRFANVDGIPFHMPIGTKTSPALFAAFSIDARRAAAMLPGQELHPFRILNRGVLLLAVVDYHDTTIGKYIEFCIGIMVTRGPTPAPPMVPLAMQNRFGTGVYIYDLPVSTEISVKGGRSIWGMAKRKANLDYIVADDMVSSQYDLDGQLVMRIDIPHPKPLVPFRLDGAGYGDSRGMLWKSYTHVRGRLGVSVLTDRIRLLIGDHPRMDVIKGLDINPRALFSGFTPVIDGVLDDHTESWFLTADAPPGPPAEGLKDLVGLGLSQEWLPPPDRVRSDRMMAEMTPRERVGPR